MKAGDLVNLSEKMNINIIGTKIVTDTDEYIDFCGGDCEITGMPTQKEKADDIAFHVMDEYGVEVGILNKSNIEITL